MKDNLKGMTVNERLYSLGLLDRFDEAINNGNKESSVSILLEAKFTLKQAEETVSKLLQTT